MEVLDDDFVRPRYVSFRRYEPAYGQNLFTAELIHFRRVDAQQDLPPGTAKRLLTDVVARYHGAPIQLRENTVRYWWYPPEEESDE